MKKWRFVIAILIVAFMLLILPIKISKTLRNYTWDIIRPAGLFFKMSVGRTFPFLRDTLHFGQIVKQNSDLVKENSELQSELAKLTEMKNENEILKQELGFMKTQDLTTTTAAAVIGQSTDYLKSLVIDKGENDGITNGNAVISQGILIGLVSEARVDNSTVTLITDSNSLIPVVLQNSRGTGLLHGGLSGLTVKDIPLNINITKGENVVTSGLGGQIPGGILIGKVNNVISKESEIFQEVAVSSQIDFSRLEVVFVIKK